MEKYLTINLIETKYVDSLPADKEKPALVFIHGNSSSSRSFMPLFETELAQRYRLIALDLPGHGASSALEDPVGSYSLPFFSAFLREFVQNLKLSRFALVGHSLGGHIALESLPFLKEAAGVMVFGTPPLGNPPCFSDAFLPNPQSALFFKGNVTDLEGDKAIEQLFAAPKDGVVGSASEKENLKIAKIRDLFKEDFLKTHPAVREQLALSLGKLELDNELLILQESACPVAILHGAHDQLISGDYLSRLRAPSVWRGEIQVIQDAGHMPHWESPEQFKDLLSSFAEDIFGAQTR